MIILLANDLDPFLREGLNRLIVKFERRRHLRPDEQPFDVAPVQESGVFDLHMLANAVIPHRHDLIDVFENRFLRRRR
ncbi:hypothetical protein D3C73_1346930 [compost metagenome]